MFADIASLHSELSDVLLLIAAVLFAVAVVDAVRPMHAALGTFCVRAGLTLLAVAWLVL